MPNKNTICLWYEGAADEAARFYAKTFPNSAVGATQRAPGDYPAGKQGDVDKWGVSWQVTPRALIAALCDPDRAAAKRAFDAMMTMKKIDIATIEAGAAELKSAVHRNRSTHMSYIDGFVIAVPTANKQQFIAHANKIDSVFTDHGATRVVECWGRSLASRRSVA